MREVRQVATGKYLNERILGRLDPEMTNFSIVMPSEFESMYGYNADYQFEVEEELHDVGNGEIMLLTDEVVGTLFDRESTRYEHGSSDRDWTFRFILKTFKRTLKMKEASAQENNTVVELINVNIAAGTFNFLGSGTATEANRSMFGKNLSRITVASDDEAEDQSGGSAPATPGQSGGG